MGMGLNGMEWDMTGPGRIGQATIGYVVLYRLLLGSLYV